MNTHTKIDPLSDCGRLLAAIERVTEDLADPFKWNWAHGGNRRDAADSVLRLMKQHGLIQGKEHPQGGLVWRSNGRIFGRIDGITNQNFENLKPL